ncbi:MULTISPECIES: hypothetical protein [Pseudoalteromonas]|uniref:Phage shock protein B n=2 Tax=Pseudoalteromonas TaxID=53246 RepID=A0A8I2KLG5_9GAMM|nr:MULTISPECIES: hypothetical protein [Pseudoalteromonas]AXQ98387.1 hypothetical protein D0N37_12045 [Pseudoalteromonas piscicida]KID38110.1 hypothetical protein QT15_04925 [Pseudoalteromonas flavipulchra NCIMB 2033 = ATCC BAA-314]KJY92827.1 hypothetical protein TW75_00640 [Pseudoalteromonas piscicida]MBD0782716.1 hypothetical protein [Pseudoalteromonas flavipulchra]MBE0372298.1 hypothetical protein [Pseudoalteromonas flavipulchra NCIMB 2033 = ATCC BAA-314]
MSGTTMVFLIVLISVGGGILSEMYKRRLEYKKLDSQSQKERDQLHAELNALKSRVAILEQIVTDEGYQVKKDINSL